MYNVLHGHVSPFKCVRLPVTPDSVFVWAWESGGGGEPKLKPRENGLNKCLKFTDGHLSVLVPYMHLTGRERWDGFHVLLPTPRRTVCSLCEHFSYKRETQAGSPCMGRLQASENFHCPSNRVSWQTKFVESAGSHRDAQKCMGWEYGVVGRCGLKPWHGSNRVSPSILKQPHWRSQLHFLSFKWKKKRKEESTNSVNRTLNRENQLEHQFHINARIMVGEWPNASSSGQVSFNIADIDLKWHEKSAVDTLGSQCCLQKYLAEPDNQRRTSRSQNI